MVKSYRTNNLAKARNYRHINTTSETDSDSDYEVWSDDKSLAELEGDELEANLSALHKKAGSPDAPKALKYMMSHKNLKEWKKIEANQALGYTKGSTRTGAKMEGGSRTRSILSRSQNLVSITSYPKSHRRVPEAVACSLDQ
ncbi:hypothetical protein JB92DRAFT_727866 [Gautieria morchelliformis]|nr:hypothetical protein JB92DRAFT_727866 [Gautieria morchelliformis]